MLHEIVSQWFGNRKDDSVAEAQTGARAVVALQKRKQAVELAKNRLLAIVFRERGKEKVLVRAIKKRAWITR
jgi:hypothetical protein